MVVVVVVHLACAWEGIRLVFRSFYVKGIPMSSESGTAAGFGKGTILQFSSAYYSVALKP